MKDNLLLSKNELILMNILWDSATAMSSVDIGHILPEWKNNGYLHSTLKILVLKNYLIIDDYVVKGKHSVKCYKPKITKEDYALHLLSPLNLKSDDIPLISMCLLRSCSDKKNNELLNELEEIYRDFLKNENDI